MSESHSSPVDDEKCAICQDVLKSTTSEVQMEIKTLPCNHHFHKMCIEQWIQIKNKCPLCNQRADPTLPETKETHEDNEDLTHDLLMRLGGEMRRQMAGLGWTGLGIPVMPGMMPGMSGMTWVVTASGPNTVAFEAYMDIPLDPLHMAMHRSPPVPSPPVPPSPSLSPASRTSPRTSLRTPPGPQNGPQIERRAVHPLAALLSTMSPQPSPIESLFHSMLSGSMNYAEPSYENLDEMGQCTHCHHVQPSQRFLQCEVCHAKYCSPDCQRQDWDTHRHQCQRRENQ